MDVSTKFLGTIEISDSDIVTFERGIPGFQHLRKFAIIPLEDNPVLSYIQSVEEEQVCFVVVPPFALVNQYDIEISDYTVKELELKDPGEVILYAILTIHGDIKNITANLKAPIVINKTNRKAVQELLDDDRFEIRHRVFRGE